MNQHPDDSPPRSRTTETSASPSPAAWKIAAGVAVMSSLVLGAYALLWRDWSDFVRAIDHTRWLFNDFRFHFYPMALEILEAREPVAGYFYSAFFALLIRPFAWIPIDEASRFWGALQVLSFLVLAAAPLGSMVRFPRRHLPLLALLYLTSYPALNNFKWGQVSFLLTLLAIAAFEASSRRRPVLAGVLLAIAASIKYYSGIFILVFLFRRDWRACASFTLMGLLCFAVIPAIVLGPENWISFHQSALRALSGSSWISGDPNSQYFAHVAGRWMGETTQGGGMVSRLLVFAGFAVALLNLGLAWMLRHLESPEALGLSLLLVMTALPFAVATSWPHYFVYLPFLQAASLTALHRRLLDERGALRTVQLAIGISVLVACVPFFLLFPTWASYQEKGFLLVANTLLLPPLYLWAVRVRREATDIRIGQEA